MILSNNSNDKLMHQMPSSDPIISDVLRLWLENVFSIISICFGILGVVTNAINIRVFIQQGVLNESNTIGLFALAIADFVGCLSGIPSPACQLIRHVGSLPVFSTCYAITSLVSSVLHLIMSRVTCWITVYITIERSLCVLLPFKVKQLLRPKVTATSMILIYSIICGSYIPFYVETQIIWHFNSNLNATVAAFFVTSGGNLIASVLSFIYNTILTSVAFCIVLLATVLIVYKLLASRKWRMSASKASNSEQNQGNSRDLEAMKMVTVVTGLFLVCVSMGHIPGFAIFLLQGVSFTGINQNLYYVAYYIKMMFSLINSSLNFFFYIRVSSRFKKTFIQVFRK